jgi:hypothetical protein
VITGVAACEPELRQTWLNELPVGA